MTGQSRRAISNAHQWPLTPVAAHSSEHPIPKYRVLTDACYLDSAAVMSLMAAIWQSNVTDGGLLEVADFNSAMVGQPAISLAPGA